MYTIGWLEMGEKEKAGQLFRKNYFYIKNAFQVINPVFECEYRVNPYWSFLSFFKIKYAALKMYFKLFSAGNCPISGGHNKVMGGGWGVF